jgi:prepilin-type N-terminal cleavage/methylation domain-containing protein
MKVKKRKGFTLLEIMIVIAIMAMLAAILLAWVQRARAQAKLAACMATMKNMALSVEQYRVDNVDAFPPEDLQSLVPVYMKIVPQNSQTSVYGYVVDFDTKEYTIYCQGLNHVFLNVPADFPRYCFPGGQMFGTNNYGY